MELERRYSVLAVSASLKFVETLRTLLPEGRYGPVTVLHDAAAARRALAENSYDLVLINTPLPDEFGTRLALDACESSSAGVLLLVKAEHCPDIEAQVSAHGVLTLAKPTSAQLFAQTLRLLCITRERHGEKSGDAAGENGGDSIGEPGKVAADRGAENDGAGGSPLYRKAGHGPLRDPAGRGGADFIHLSVSNEYFI